MAQFNIGSTELKKVITQISPMFKGGFDNTPRILLEVKDKVSMSATNGDAYTKIVFDCDIVSQGDFVVSGTLFENIVKKAKDETINIALSDDKQRLTITMGTYKFQIATIEVQKEFFNAPIFEQSNTFTMKAQDLKTAINSVSCCIDQAKQHLNCVMMHTDQSKPNKICVVATDGMRLGIADRDAKYMADVPNLMIPKKASEFILTMLGDLQGEISVNFTENMIQLSTGSIFYTAKLLDTSFPRYQSVVPTANNKILDVKVVDLRDAIERLSAMAEITYRIKLTLFKDKVEISCEDNGNDAQGVIEATFTEGEALEVVCNFRLLKEILEKLDSSMVRFQFMDASTPILIRSVDDDSVKYVFMPFVN